MAKKIVLSILITILVLLVVFFGFLVSYFNNTTNDVTSFSKNLSYRDADDFYIVSYKNEDVQSTIFVMAVNGNKENGQELFVFSEKPFGMITNTGRYKLVYHSVPDVLNDVGTLLYPLKDKKGNKSDRNVLIFYSENQNKYNNGTYISSISKNGNDIKQTVDFGLTENEPFICISEPLSFGENVDSAVFTNNDKSKSFNY